jgi:hypothetical protein
MAFRAKRLGVQLPCGPVTVIEAAGCPLSICQQTICPWGSICGGATWICYWPSCIQSWPGLQPQGGPIILEADDLADLREQLEAQLKEVDEAQRKLSEREGKTSD